MPRLFAGLEIPASVAAELARLRGGVPGARWIEPDALHITLRFIGDIDHVLADEVAVALGEVSCLPFLLGLNGVGVFGNRKPRSIWAGVDPEPALNMLQGSVERACIAAGLEPERRKFTPHITLARLKGASAGDVPAFIADHNLFRSPPFAVERFVLFSARPSRGGGPYIVEQAYDLSPAM